jgi:spore coat polysaccharide biosynthesis protein SpsF
VIATIQARFTSQRLPGKVLRPLRGRPLLAHLLDSLQHCRTLDGIILATSRDDADDPVAAFATAAGVACYRGPLHDVATRMLQAAGVADADAIVRISGDSPLLDPALVDHAVDVFRAQPVDLVSNVVRRTFPRGQSVEVISTRALARAIPGMATADEREHVTTHFYRRPACYLIRSFEAEHPRPDVQLSVDEPADLARCEAILALLDRPHWQAGWEACVRQSDAVCERAKA